MSTSENNEENTDSMISTTEDDGQNVDSDIEAGSGRRKLWWDTRVRCQRFGGKEACYRGDWWACGMCGLPLPPWRRRMSTSENNEENTDSMISTTEDDGQNSGNGSGTRRELSAQQHWRERTCRGMMFADIEAGSGRRKLGWWIDRDLQCQRFGGWEACDRGVWWACMMCSYEPVW